jgi:hypothetical protein
MPADGKSNATRLDRNSVARLDLTKPMREWRRQPPVVSSKAISRQLNEWPAM